MAGARESSVTFNIISGQKQVKKLQNRVTYSQNGLKDLSFVLSEYLSKHASMQDKAEHVAESLANFAEREPYNTTTKLRMIASSEAISLYNDYRTTHVKKLEEKVLPLLSSYEGVCKKVKAVLRDAKVAREKEAKKKKTFEQEKSRDMKETLVSFLKFEMALHAMALEIYSEAFGYVDSIDEKADLQVIKTGMILHGTKPLSEHKSKSDCKRKNFPVPSSPPYTTTITSLDRYMERKKLSGGERLSSHFATTTTEKQDKKEFSSSGSSSSSDSESSCSVTDGESTTREQENHNSHFQKDKKASFHFLDTSSTDLNHPTYDDEVVKFPSGQGDCKSNQNSKKKYPRLSVRIR